MIMACPWQSGVCFKTIIVDKVLFVPAPLWNNQNLKTFQKSNRDKVFECFIVVDNKRLVCVFQDNIVFFHSS